MARRIIVRHSAARSLIEGDENTAEINSNVPRYVQILNFLTKRMEAGIYGVHMRLPTEVELCEEFDASRFTVREALRRLVELGMVERRQGAGSVVVSTTPQTRYVHSVSSLRDLFQFALNTDYELLSVERVMLEKNVALGIGATIGESWHLMKGLRRQKNSSKDLYFLHSYIAPRAAEYVAELKQCVGPFYAHLSERTGETIIDVEQDIYGIAMTNEVASYLKCRAGTIATCALRRYVSEKGTLIASYNWHKADSFYFRTKMSRTN